MLQTSRDDVSMRIVPTTKFLPYRIFFTIEKKDFPTGQHFFLRTRLLKFSVILKYITDHLIKAWKLDSTLVGKKKIICQHLDSMF